MFANKDVERFFSKVEVGQDCWTWKGGMAGNYGRFYVNRIAMPAHRFSYMQHYGEMPDNLILRHQCNNTRCVRPHHLVLGTQLENNLDCIKSGRHIQTSKTHCKRGHEFTSLNTYIDKRGHRSCRACWSVYNHNKRAGIKTEQTPLERLQSWTHIDTETQCHLVERGLQPSGYARLSVNGQMMTAHVFMYMHANELSELPSGMVVRHSENCRGRRNCINPDHLSLGTQGDNIRDMVQRGRHFQQAKTHCPRGHSYSGENLYITKVGGRMCLTCVRKRTEERDTKHRLARSSG